MGCTLRHTAPWYSIVLNKSSGTGGGGVKIGPIEVAGRSNGWLESIGREILTPEGFQSKGFLHRSHLERFLNFAPIFAPEAIKCGHVNLKRMGGAPPMHLTPCPVLGGG